MNLFEMFTPGGEPEPEETKSAADFDTTDTPVYCSHGHMVKIVNGPMGTSFYEITFVGHDWDGDDHNERALVSLRFPVSEAVDLSFAMIDGIGKLDPGSLLVGTMQFSAGIAERVEKTQPVRPNYRAPSDMQIIPLDEESVRKLFQGMQTGDDEKNDPPTGQYL